MKIFEKAYEKEFKRYLASIGSGRLVHIKENTMNVLEEYMDASHTEFRHYENEGRAKLRILDDYCEYGQLYVATDRMSTVEFGEIDLDEPEYSDHLKGAVYEAIEREGD